MGLKRAIISEREDFCTECNTKRAIECYNKYDKPIYYSNFLDRFDGTNMDILLKKNELSYMRCTNCGKIYDIFWNIDKKPIPMRNTLPLDYFLDDKYKK